MPLKLGKTGARYREIARDLAKRIANHEFPPGSKLHGRSTLTSYYRVSPETVRRALRVLQDHQVIQVEHGSGVRVLSPQNAEEFLSQDGLESDLFDLHDHLRVLLAQRDQLNQEINTVYAQIFATALSYMQSPHLIREIVVEPNDSLCGVALDPVKLWVEKSLRVVSVKREGSAIAPDQAGTILPGDILVVVNRPREDMPDNT